MLTGRYVSSVYKCTALYPWYTMRLSICTPPAPHCLIALVYLRLSICVETPSRSIHWETREIYWARLSRDTFISRPPFLSSRHRYMLNTKYYIVYTIHYTLYRYLNMLSSPCISDHNRFALNVRKLASSFYIIFKSECANHWAISGPIPLL